MGMFCQSCGMPIDESQLQGTEKGGAKSQEYCMYCYEDGKFAQEMTMEDMIDHCLQYLDDFNKDTNQKLTKEEAKQEMMKFFPTLKRWQKGELG